MALVDYRLAELLTSDDGRTIEWERIGDGSPLMWVEGGAGFWAHLARPDVELVADLFTCYLVNAPGCGRTSPPATIAGYDLPGIVGFFDDARQRLGLGAVTVMGHSWGGLVAAAWAAAHPETVERVIVVDGYPGGIDGSNLDPAVTEAEYQRAIARHRNAPWYADAVGAFEEESDVAAATEYEQGSTDEEQAMNAFDAAWPLYFSDPASPLSAPHLARIRREVRMNMDLYGSWFDATPHFDGIDIRPALAGVRCPALVIVGEHDLICGPSWNRPIADAIPGARYVEVPNAGHLPQYEQPEAFRAALIDWLA